MCVYIYIGFFYLRFLYLLSILYIHVNFFFPHSLEMFLINEKSFFFFIYLFGYNFFPFVTFLPYIWKK